MLAAFAPACPRPRVDHRDVDPCGARPLPCRNYGDCGAASPGAADAMHIIVGMAKILSHARRRGCRVAARGARAAAFESCIVRSGGTINSNTRHGISPIGKLVSRFPDGIVAKPFRQGAPALAQGRSDLVRGGGWGGRMVPGLGTPA